MGLSIWSRVQRGNKNVGVHVIVRTVRCPEVEAGAIGREPVVELCGGAAAGLDVDAHPDDAVQSA